MASRLIRHRVALVSLLFFGEVMLSSADMEPPAFTMSRPPSAAGVTIVGGTASNLLSFAAALRYRGNGQDCSANAIGPRTILIAAHCVRPRAHGRIDFPDTSHTWATCTLSDKFDGEHNDVALCLTDDSIPLPRHAWYETINRDPSIPPTGGTLLLQGIGCRRSGGGGKSGILAEGPARISVAMDSQGQIHTVGDPGKGGVAVCSGDSGGGAYLRGLGESRTMVGVNAAGDRTENSVITALASPALDPFFAAWTSPICVRGKEMSTCHG
ncbi:trypsin-like serine protease [Sphingomonas sp. PR090111-T3T-6A]|uniref:trypsin-like serine protease n=1 Tax=Sphingomonas sp. PR090111-T3T-6A TaxID=685778 RepID=UPI0003694028|nr:trypsin-like serine protease [Sphingomonas sp. PR090111-T3T-6A]